MLFRAAFVLLPVVAFAQTPPPEVDEALRARVTEFFQYHVDANFRKAYELVAEDTKEQYFGAQKWQFKSFKIDSIKYSDNFTKAEVQVTGQRMWRMRPDLPEVPVSLPMATLWQVENGKWMYHEEPRQINTPMGPSAAPPKTEDGKPKLPNVSPEAIAAAARNILQQSSVDKTELTLAPDKASSERVVFHNGFQGTVQVALESDSKVPGLKAELDKTSLNAGENAVIKVGYEPAGKEPRNPVTLRLTVQPFKQVFTITVKFAASPKEQASGQWPVVSGQQHTDGRQAFTGHWPLTTGHY